MSSMKPWAKGIIAVVVALVLVLGWLVYFHNAGVAARAPAWLQSSVKAMGRSGTAAAEEDEDPDNTKNEIPVHTGHVGVATLHRYVEAFGSVAPRPPRKDEMAGSANVASPTPGVVAKVLCTVGQRVKAGEAVLQLDDRLAKSAEAQAAAALAQARASLAALKATPRPAVLEIAQLNVRKSESALEFAQHNYDRLKQLAGSESTSTKSVEQAGQDLAAARTDLAINQKQLDLLKHTPAPEDLRQEEAKVAQAEAALATARVQLQMTTITAPIDATVVNVLVNPGESVDVTKTLVQFTALDRLVIDVDVPADQLPAKPEGLDAQILLPNTPAGATPLVGKVSFVSPQVDPRTGAVLAIVDLPADANLRPGLSVRVRVVAEEHKDCLTVPRAAVVADENGDSVIALVEGDQATHKTVKRGLEENGLVEVIADGLKEGDTVATAGAFGLPQASRVKVID